MDRDDEWDEDREEWNEDFLDSLESPLAIFGWAAIAGVVMLVIALSL